MNHLKNTLIISLALIAFSGCSSKPKEAYTVEQGVIPVIKMYDYKKLQLREYGGMLKLIRSRIDKAEEIAIRSQEEGEERKAEGKVLILLKNAMTLVLTRPNTSNDNLVAKLSPIIKSELNNYEAYYRTMDTIISASLNKLNDPKTTINHKVGSTFILDNAMSELRPELKREPEAKAIFKKIRDAQIVLDRKVSSQRLLQAMASSSSPSDVAKKILDKTFPEEIEKGFFEKMFN